YGIPAVPKAAQKTIPVGCRRSVHRCAIVHPVPTPQREVVTGTTIRTECVASRLGLRFKEECPIEHTRGAPSHHQAKVHITAGEFTRPRTIRFKLEGALPTV